MEVINDMKKLISILIVASISITALSGCSSKSASANANTSSSNKTQMHKNFDPSAIKTRYETVLKELVSDKTITQDQSDKIIAEITKQASNRPQNSGNKKNLQNNKQSGGQGSNGQHRNGGNRGNQLSSLVSSGVITQAQVDAITQKLRESNAK